MIRRLEGRCAVITGASQGLGLAIARAYVAAGANVLMCARDPARLERARVEVATLGTERQQVLGRAGDISKPAQAQELATAALAAFPSIEILVNNAGVYGPIGPASSVDWDEWTETVAINLFGSILMCRHLLPHFAAQRYGKIIQLSGGGATNPLPRFSAYAASKAAIIRFAETLAEEVRDDGIDVNAIAPGALNTRLLDQVLAAGPGPAGEAFYERSRQQKKVGGASLDRAAALAVFLGSSDSDGITGKLLSATWDPWETLAAHREDLHATDVYTLRRIVPADRGLSWGQR